MRTARIATALLFLIVLGSSPAHAKINQTWVYEADHPASSLVCYANHAFAGFPNGKIVALSIDSGNVLWDETAPGTGKVLLSVKAGVLYALRGRTLSILDAMTAKGLARKTLPFAVDETTLLGRTPVADRLILQHQAKTYVIDPRSGRSLFTADHPLFFGKPAQALSTRKWRDSFDELNGVGYFVDQKNVLAIDLKTGGTLWKTASPSELFGAPCLFRNLVIAAGPDILFAVHQKDGKQAWIDDRFEDRKATSPYLYFVTPKDRKRFYLHVEGGLLAHLPDSKRRNFFYLLPDPVQILFSRKHDAFLLYVYTEEKSHQPRSILFRLSNKTAQLYGPDDVHGKASGLFVRSGSRIYPELQPGVLFELGRKECAILDRVQISDHAIRLMDIVGHAVIIATAEKKLIGINVK